jgi:hypothetical protein
LKSHERFAISLLLSFRAAKVTTKKIPDAFFWLWNNPETPLKARRPAAVNIMRLRKVFVKGIAINVMQHILVLLISPLWSDIFAVFS